MTNNQIIYESLVQRIRRFLKNQKVSDRDIYNPIAEGMVQAASVGDRIRLILDVTPLYGTLKIFSASVAYRHRAVPLVWEMNMGSGCNYRILDYQRERQYFYKGSYSPGMILRDP